MVEHKYTYNIQYNDRLVLHIIMNSNIYCTTEVLDQYSVDVTPE